MLEHLQRLVSEKPSDTELERAIRCLTGNHVINQQRDSVHAAHIALDALYGLGPDAHQHYAEQVRALTAEDILRVAQRIIQPDAYTQAVIR
jgi:zinc protease